jgi:hypothetical protein
MELLHFHHSISTTISTLLCSPPTSPPGSTQAVIQAAGNQETAGASGGCRVCLKVELERIGIEVHRNGIVRLGSNCFSPCSGLQR